MHRVFSFWTAIGLLSLAAGCSMCANPYDECGPTAQSGNGARCCPTARAGSILAGSVVHQVASPVETSEGGVVAPSANDIAPAPSPSAMPVPVPTPAVPTPTPTKQWTPSVPRTPESK